MPGRWRRSYPEPVNRLHLMNAAGLLPPELATELTAVVQAALTRHAAVLGLDGVDVAVYAAPWTLPETGVGGYAPLGHLVQLTLTPDNPHFTDCWRREVPATLAHELHHARRWRGPGYGTTLLEALVSEGLAQQYEAGVRGEVPIYAHSAHPLDTLWAQAQAELDTPGYDHAAWFFGTGEQPRWAGYALGYELVRRGLAMLGGDAVSHAETLAEAFRSAWAPHPWLPDA
jgi:GNAT superfamily N-acetyltransferase